MSSTFARVFTALVKFEHMERSKNGLPAENTVFYRLYPAETSEADAVQADNLTYLAVKCTELAKELTEDHVWHYESFRLGVCPSHAQGSATYPSHLCGSLCYRDNVEDEWLLVWLLLEITRHFPQLVTSVCDDDGQFLLIEAAHHLPKWLRPENSENRVFIYRGAVHIIPKPHTPADISRYPVATPTIREAIELVNNVAVMTKAMGVVQEAIQHRISCFPAAMKTSLHRAHCYVPWPVGHVMSRDPTLVSAAVHALCDRGAEDMKAARTMRHFSPSIHSSIMTQVTFTRCLFAKLLHQRFSPPPHSGFTLTTPTNPTHKAHDLGMKLTCGLEMLVCGVGGAGGVGGEGGDHLSTDIQWIQFLKTLKEKDYFQGELEGSRKYTELMLSAKDYFNSSIVTQRQPGEEEEEGGHRDPEKAAGLRLVRIMTSDPGSEEEVTEKCSALSPEDDDSWMEISMAELDIMMRKAAGYMPQKSREGDRGEREGEGDRGEREREGDRGEKEREGERGGTAEDKEATVENVVYGMKSFVHSVSSHKGAELPWSAGDDGKGRVEFDPDAILQMLHNMAEGGEDVTSDSGDSVDSEMKEMMEQMDHELEATGFQSSLDPGGEREGEEGDLNLARNLLSSLAAQPEAAGPTSNILHSLGIPVPEPD